MIELSPDGRNYAKRKDWTRAEWRRIHNRDQRLCACGLWAKRTVLEEYNGMCRRCKQKEEQEKMKDATN